MNNLAHGYLRCRMCEQLSAAFVETINGYDFYECAHCAFVFSDSVSQDKVTHMYESGERGAEAGAPDTGWADTEFIRPALERLEARRRPMTALDFGAGESQVPGILRGEGHRVVGVDLLPPRQPHPDRLTGDLIELQLDEESFDLAYSFQVFEHLPEPKPVILELLRLVRVGGLVAVHTDMETNERHAGGLADWWYVMPPDHCSFYRHKTFEVALREQPCRITPANEKMVLIEKLDRVH